MVFLEVHCQSKLLVIKGYKELLAQRSNNVNKGVKETIFTDWIAFWDDEKLKYTYMLSFALLNICTNLKLNVVLIQIQYFTLNLY